MCKIGNFELLETALFHDIGKKSCTNVGKDRIYAYGHALESIKLLSQFKYRIRDYDLTYRIIKKHMGFNSVGHDRIKNDTHMKDFIKADKVMSTQLYHELFFNFDDEENKRKEAEVFKNQNESKTTVYIPIGISGSGKSTYAIKKFDPAAIVCPDQIRKEINGDISSQKNSDLVCKLAKERMHIALDKYGVTYLDATNVNKYRRISFMASFNGHRKVALLFNANVEEAYSRVKKDIEENKDRSNVHANVILKQEKNFRSGLKSLEHEFNEVITVE